MSMSHSHTSQHWAHLPRCEFIQLAMIGAQGLRRGGPEEEMIRLAQQGKIETILGHKTSIDLYNLFPPHVPLVVLPPPPPPSRVFLIEGAPGGGKSTLALHICHQWAQGASWLARFDVVVLAYLRDKAVQNATTLAEILPASAADIMELVSSIRASYGKEVLFIFDGWDEFPHHLMNDSFISTIIRQPHKLSLHLSTVLITSRPVSSGNLLHIADRRVEILGFTKHQIREYIEKALDGNNIQIQKLVQHLEEHPVIEGYCYVPLHVAILVHVFLTMKGALPTTLHELFCSLVLCCIVREQATHEPDTSLPELSSLDDLPDDLKSKLSNLSILAYNGVMQNKVVFYPKDLQASHLPTDLPSLGLLQAVEGLTLYSKSLSYNFLHLSVQELLAAYSISLMVPSKQVKVFKKLFESSRFQAVLHYYSGFTKLANHKTQSFIFSFQTRKSSFKDILPLLHCFFEAQQPSLCQLVDSRFMPNEYQKLNAIDLSPVDFLAIGYFITSLLSTSTANTPTIHLVVDGIDDHRLKMLLNQLSKYPLGEIPTSAGALSLLLDNPFITEEGVSRIVFLLKILSPLSDLVLSYSKNYLPKINFLVVGYFITSLLSTSTANTPTIHLVVDGIDEHSLKMLLNELSKYPIGGIPTSAGPLSLRLDNPFITEQGVSHLHVASLLKKSSPISEVISKLELSNGNIHSDEDVLLPIAEALQTNTSLTKLGLHNMSLHYTEQNGSALINMLQVNKSLTHLDLSNNELSDSGAHSIFEGLVDNSTLVNLNLSKSGITADPDTARSLTKMLQVNKSLTHLDLSENTLLRLGVYCIFEGLEHNTTLVSLNLSHTSINITDRNTAMSFTRMLKTNKCLTHLNLSGNVFSLKIFFKGLEYNTALRHLNLRGVSDISDTDAEHIARVLKSNFSLQMLDIRDCLFLGNGFQLILESLMFNSTLQTLYIMCIHTQEENLSTFKRAREAKNLPPTDIVLSHAYSDDKF